MDPVLRVHLHKPDRVLVCGRVRECTSTRVRSDTDECRLYLRSHRSVCRVYRCLSKKRREKERKEGRKDKNLVDDENYFRKRDR